MSWIDIRMKQIDSTVEHSILIDTQIETKTKYNFQSKLLSPEWLLRQNIWIFCILSLFRLVLMKIMKIMKLNKKQKIFWIYIVFVFFHKFTKLLNWILFQDQSDNFFQCLTCDDQSASSCRQFSFSSQSVLGSTLVSLESILCRHIPDLEFSTGQHNILSI